MPALRELGEEDRGGSGSRHKRASGIVQQRRIFEEARRKKIVRIYGNLARVAASNAYGGVGGSFNDFVHRGRPVQGHSEDEVPVGLYFKSQTERPEEESFTGRRVSENPVERSIENTGASQRPNSSVGAIRPRRLEYSTREYEKENEGEAEEDPSS